MSLLCKRTDCGDRNVWNPDRRYCVRQCSVDGVTVFKLRDRDVAKGFSNAHSRIGMTAVARLSMVTGLIWLLIYLYDLVRSEYFSYVITALIGLHGVLFFYSISGSEPTTLSCGPAGESWR